MTTPPQASKSPGSGEPGQQPVEPRTRVVPAAPPAPSTVETAVTALGDLLHLAFSDAVRVDQLSRQTVNAWENIDAEDRIALGDRHAGLVEALLLLENQVARMDRR